MRLKKLIIKNLYGYLNKSINFNSEINILVGINGSGKTSVLNIIQWIINLDLAKLTTLYFTYIGLSYTYKTESYEIQIHQNNKYMKIHLIKNNIIKYEPLTIDLRHKRKPNIKLTEGEIDAYDGLRPDKNEKKTWDILKALPAPFAVGLERYSKDNEDGNPSTKIESYFSIKQVRDITRSNYSIYRNKIISLNEELNSEFWNTAFDVSISERLAKSAKLNVQSAIKTAQRLKLRAQDYLLKYSKDSVHFNNRKDKIIIYFRELINVLGEIENSKRDKLKEVLIKNEIHKIEELLRSFENFDRSTESAYLHIKIYLEAINQFLCDSSKQIYFTEDTNELMYQVLDEEQKIVYESGDIEFLSSGEKQIIILLTFLAFNPSPIFIIDEPELSLHPKWQEDFLAVALKIKNLNTQLIIATHSPSIVGKNRKFCKTLFPN